MTGTLSLRARLTAIILTPLVVIAAIVGFWAIRDAQARADARFDRGLLSAALAVSRDVAISGGDALSPETNALLRDTSGGRVFYHVYAPDGAFVTGFATPPVPVTDATPDQEGQQHFEGVHQSRAVRAVRFRDSMAANGLSGEFTVTVWQDSALRNAFVRELVQATILVIALLIVSLALVVWFGVRLGLRPLNDLEEAIARRSSEELSTIQRDVPAEVTGIVNTLNALFGQVRRSMAAQNDFISNAAHQLRNPIAGVLSLAEAVASAPNGDAAKSRAGDLLAAARETADLSQKLLLLERAKAAIPSASQEVFDLSGAVATWADDMATALPDGITFDREIAPGLTCLGDQTMLREALRNLFDNALRHGGPTLTHLHLTCTATTDGLRLTFRDNGTGIAAENVAAAKTRFHLLSPTSGSGLGLSIVDTIAQNHDGHLSLASADPGLIATVELPKAHPT